MRIDAALDDATAAGRAPRLAPCLESLAVHGEQPAALRAALHGTMLVLGRQRTALHNALMRVLGNALILRGNVLVLLTVAFAVPVST